MSHTSVTHDTTEFVRRTEPFRRELLAHCYRMLGSVHDAEDVVQETYLRAWRGFGGFEERSSVRVWLYRIATNACLTALQGRSRRVLPSGLAGPGEEAPAGGPVDWLEPIPDALVSPESADPAAIVVSREDLRLALIASLQYLPARQRAVLLLREVLACSAAEVAQMLGTSTAAVKSTLQRARARLDEVSPIASAVSEPSEPDRRAQLQQYITAFETSDAALLEKLLREDATLEVTPFRSWSAGKQTCMGILRHVLGAPGDWRMFPTSANGRPAAVAYHRDDTGAYAAYGVAVLEPSDKGVAALTVFGDPALCALFGFAPALSV